MYETILKFKHYTLTLYSWYIPSGALIGPKLFRKALWSFQTHPLIFQNQCMFVIKKNKKREKINGNRIFLQHNRTKGKYIKQY